MAKILNPYGNDIPSLSGAIFNSNNNLPIFDKNGTSYYHTKLDVFAKNYHDFGKGKVIGWVYVRIPNEGQQSTNAAGTPVVTKRGVINSVALYDGSNDGFGHVNVRLICKVNLSVDFSLKKHALVLNGFCHVTFQNIQFHRMVELNNTTFLNSYPFGVAASKREIDIRCSDDDSPNFYSFSLHLIELNYKG
jgi:hypothetical protein